MNLPNELVNIVRTYAQTMFGISVEGGTEKERKYVIYDVNTNEPLNSFELDNSPGMVHAYVFPEHNTYVVNQNYGLFVGQLNPFLLPTKVDIFFEIQFVTDNCLYEPRYRFNLKTRRIEHSMSVKNYFGDNNYQILAASHDDQVMIVMKEDDSSSREVRYIFRDGKMVDKIMIREVYNKSRAVKLHVNFINHRYYTFYAGKNIRNSKPVIYDMETKKITELSIEPIYLCPDNSVFGLNKVNGTDFLTVYQPKTQYIQTIESFKSEIIYQIAVRVTEAGVIININLCGTDGITVVNTNGKYETYHRAYNELYIGI